VGGFDRVPSSQVFSQLLRSDHRPRRG
jgi:hypothetical protein